MKLEITVSDGEFKYGYVASLTLLKLARMDYGTVLLTIVNRLADRVNAKALMATAGRGKRG